MHQNITKSFTHSKLQKCILPKCYLLSSTTPESMWSTSASGWWEPFVASASPEPSVGVDGLKGFRLAALADKVALPSRSVDGRHVVGNHDLFKHFELPWSVETHEVHALFAAKISAVKPIPVLKFVPWLPPRQKVVMVS